MPDLERQATLDARQRRRSEVSTCLHVDFSTRRVTARVEVSRLDPKEKYQEHVSLIQKHLRSLAENGLDIDATARTICAVSVAENYFWTDADMAEALRLVRSCATPEARRIFVCAVRDRMSDLADRCYARMVFHRDIPENRKMFLNGPDNLEALFQAMDFVMCALFAAQRSYRRDRDVAIP